MDATDLYKKIEYFLEIHRFKNKKAIVVDFNVLSKFDIELTEHLENNFEDFKKAFEDTYEEKYERKIEFRIKNLPQTYQLGIGAIRKKHLDKFKQFEGTVIRVGDVRIKPDIIKFECPSCGNLMKVKQIDDYIKEPKKCGCGRKGKFKKISTVWKNIQYIFVEEHIIDYTDKKAKPTLIKVELEEGLTREKLTKKLQPGKHIIFTGIIKAKQKNPKKVFFDYEIKANYIKVIDISLFNLEIPDKLKKQFKEIDKVNILKNLKESLFFGIRGQDKIKEILTIARARGVKTYYQDKKLDMRDTINVFLVGNPGTAKSDMAKMAVKADVINMTVSGKGVSGVGLTASTMRDKDLECWVVEPGAVPRCNKGSIVIDECFPPDTEILTEKGFIKFKDLKEKIKVAQYHKDGKVSFIFPERIVRKPHSGELIKIKSYFGSHTSTLSHNRVLFDRNNKLHKLKAKYSLKSSYKVPVNGVHNGVGINLKDDELRFIVAFIADGYIKNKEYGYISFKKQRKIKRFERLCNKLKIHYSVNCRNGYNHYYIGNAIKKYFKKEHGEYIKKFEHEWITKLSLKQKEIILKELVYWDGYKPSKNCWQYFTSDKDELNTISSIATTAGYFTHIYPRKKKGYKDNYALTFQKKKTKTQQRLRFSMIPYNGDVYCATVKTGMIIIKQDGHIQVTGNCDKIEDKDTSALNEGMVNLSFMITKANQQVTLQSDVSIVACANPDGRKFDDYTDRYKQITLKPDFLDRFDIWVAVEKLDKEEEHKKVIGKIVDRFEVEGDKKKGVYDLEFIKYYFAWIIQNFKPVIKQESRKYLIEKISDLMAGTSKTHNNISYRLVGNIIRFSQAYAKINQSNEVKKEHIDKIMELFNYSFKSLDMIDDDGKVSVEKLQLETPKAKKKEKYDLIEIIRNQFEKKKEPVNHLDILEIWKNKGGNEQSFEENLSKLIRRGDIFEPKRGYIKPI